MIYQFTERQLNWLEEHRDLIDKGEFYKLNHKANLYYEGEDAIRTMQFPGAVNYLLTESGIDTLSGLKEVPDRWFWACKDITEFKTKSDCGRIGMCALQSCSNLKHIELNEGLMTIDKYAFEACESLEDFKLPKSVKEICIGAFIKCLKLNNIYYDGTLEEFRNILKARFEAIFDLGTKIQCSDGVADIKSEYKRK